MSKLKLKYGASFSKLKQNHPINRRETIKMLHDVEGEIISLDSINYAIQLRRNIILLPVNLPDVLHESGLKVVFSGEMKRTNTNELWAAEPMMLTAIATK